MPSKDANSERGVRCTLVPGGSVHGGYDDYDIVELYGREEAPDPEKAEAEEIARQAEGGKRTMEIPPEDALRVWKEIHDNNPLEYEKLNIEYFPEEHMYAVSIDNNEMDILGPGAKPATEQRELESKAEQEPEEMDSFKRELVRINRTVAYESENIETTALGRKRAFQTELRRGPTKTPGGSYKREEELESNQTESSRGVSAPMTVHPQGECVSPTGSHSDFMAEHWHESQPASLAVATKSASSSQILGGAVDRKLEPASPHASHIHTDSESGSAFQVNCSPQASRYPKASICKGDGDKIEHSQQLNSCAKSTTGSGTGEKKNERGTNTVYPVQRDALSDIDEVSTDHDFIKVNFIQKGSATVPVTKGKPISSQREGTTVRSHKRPILRVTQHLIGADGKVSNEEIGHARAKEESSHEEMLLGSEIQSLSSTRTKVAAGGVPSQHGTNKKTSLDRFPKPPSPEESSKNIEAAILLTELRKHISEGNKAENPSENCFVFNHKKPAAELSSVTDIGDFKNRDLFGSLRCRTLECKFEHVWVKVANGALKYYQSKGVKSPDISGSEDCFEDPQSPETFHRLQHVIDLQNTRMFVSKLKSGWWNCLFCCSSFIDPSKLVDITDVKIKMISEHNNRYTLVLVDDKGSEETHILSHLDLVFHHSDSYHYFRMDSVDSFLRWALLYRIRKNNEICRISTP